MLFDTGSVTISGTFNATPAWAGTKPPNFSSYTITKSGKQILLHYTPGTATKLVITGSSSQTAGGSQNLTITAEDSYGGKTTSYTGSKNLTFSGASSSPSGTAPRVSNSGGTAIAFGSTTAITFSSGVATVSGSANGVMTLYKAETATISVTDGSISSSGDGNLSVTVSASADSAYRISAASGTPTAGASDALTITLVDQYQNVSSYSGDKTLTFSGLGTAPSGDVPTVASKTGSVVTEGTGTTITFASGSISAGGSLVAYKKEGPVTLTATDQTLSTSTPGGAGVSLTVCPASPNKLVMKTEPSASVTASGTFSQQPAVYVEDTYGNVVTGDSTSTVTASVQAGTGPLTGTTTATASSGVATFSGLAAPTLAQTGLKLTFTDNSPGSPKVDDATSITVTHCAAGDVTANPPWYVDGNNRIVITLCDSYGLGKVQALRLNNCTMTAQAYNATGSALGSALSLIDPDHGGGYVTLPDGTVKVVCLASLIPPNTTGSCNAQAQDMCGQFSATADPVMTRLTIAGGGGTQQILTGILSAERLLRVQNGTPGLTKLTVVVNGYSYVLAPLSDGASLSLDVGAAMIPGEGNTVVLLGEGAEGASATVTVGDSPARDPMIVVNPIAMQIAGSAQGVQLSWPATATAAGYLLQSRPSLAPSDGWVNWPAVPESVNGRWVLTVAAEGSARLFRLYKPRA